MDTIEKIEKIELKVRQLALKLERTQERNSQLYEENKQLKEKVISEKDKAKLLEEKLSKISTALQVKQGDDTTDVKELRKEVDHYIKEIDKCIDWLGEL